MLESFKRVVKRVDSNRRFLEQLKNGSSQVISGFLREFFLTADQIFRPPAFISDRKHREYFLAIHKSLKWLSYPKVEFCFDGVLVSNRFCSLAFSTTFKGPGLTLCCSCSFGALFSPTKIRPRKRIFGRCFVTEPGSI